MIQEQLLQTLKFLKWHNGGNSYTHQTPVMIPRTLWTQSLACAVCSKCKREKVAVTVIEKFLRIQLWGVRSVPRQCYRQWGYTLPDKQHTTTSWWRYMINDQDPKKSRVTQTTVSDPKNPTQRKRKMPTGFAEFLLSPGFCLNLTLRFWFVTPFDLRFITFSMLCRFWDSWNEGCDVQTRD